VKRYVKPGETVTMPIAYSEVAVHLRVAGKARPVTLQAVTPAGDLPKPVRCLAQLLDENGKPYSFPVLPGEAGFYHDDGGYYFYDQELAPRPGSKP
jgi:hypothetical protein